MLRKLLRFFGASLVMLLATQSSVMAHHGFGLLYDVTDQVSITGTVKKFTFKNPHSALVLDVVDQNGKVQEWHCEAQARSVLMRKGMKPGDIKPGDKIALQGSRGRNKSNECEVGTWTLADGSTRVMRSSKGRADVAVNTRPVTTPVKNRSVFGRWMRVTFAGIPAAKESFAAITEAGIESNASYSGFTDDPTLACRPANPVRAWAAPGQPTEIRWREQKVFIQHEFMDHTRIIYMDVNQIPADAQANEMGISVGRLEGMDLIVDTKLFTDGVLLTHVGESGLTHSNEMQLQERFHVNQQSGVLEYQWEAKDPLYFGKPFTGGIELSATELEIGRFDCVPYTAIVEPS